VVEDNFSILVAILRVLAREQIRARQRLAPHAGFELVKRVVPELPAELGLVEKIMQLRSTMDFASTRIEALADLAQEAQVVELPARARLWSIGDVADHALVILRGSVGGANPERHLRFELGAGSLVGSMDSLAGEPRWYDAVASSELSALRLGAETTFDVIEDNLDMATEMVRVFARTTRALQDRMSQLEPSRPIA
jgi:CRP-like cAMP-binding protein